MAASGVDTRHLLAPVGVVLLDRDGGCARFRRLPGERARRRHGDGPVARARGEGRGDHGRQRCSCRSFSPRWCGRRSVTGRGGSPTLSLRSCCRSSSSPAVISLAVGAVEGGFSRAGSAGTKFGDVVVGIALLLLATFSPFVLLRLIPAVEAGAISHLEGARHRLTQTAIAAPEKALDSFLKKKGKGDEKQQLQQLQQLGVGEAPRETPSVPLGGPMPTEEAVAKESANLAPLGQLWIDTHGSKGSGSSGSTGSGSGSGSNSKASGPKGAIEASSRDTPDAQPPASGHDV